MKFKAYILITILTVILGMIYFIYPNIIENINFAKNKEQNIANQQDDISKTPYINFDKETLAKREIIQKKIGENYIDSIISSGKIIRWNQKTFPLKIYIENNQNLPPYYYEEIKNAFEKWQNVSKDLITFAFTQNPKTADIRCTFPTNFERKCGVSNISAWHNFKYKKNILEYSEIKFAKVSCNRKLYSPQTIYTTALHEIGHSLGLNGHSSDKTDIMYPVTSSNNKISKRDIQTLKLLYSILPDISNSEFTQNEKKSLILPDELWENHETRIDMQLLDIKKNIDTSKHASFSEYAKLGELYFEKQDYENAIINYQKALNLSTEKITQSVLYEKLAITYLKLNNYDNALTSAQLAQKLSPTPEGLTLVANIHYQTGNYSQAKTLLRKSINKNPKTYDAYKILYNIYLIEKNYKAALSIYEQGKLNFPENPPIKLKK